jgi:phenylpropionate dioxygenase-like ring-hydroxylating dioxygenase large terminal subunit
MMGERTMITSNDSVELARRALVHMRKRTTDQAPAMMEQPVEAYNDPERFRREVDRIFHHLPLGLALSIELPSPGSYKAMTVMEKPIILVRGEDGVARAFINACRHRGAMVCEAGSGTTKRFLCPYHAWRYDLQGQLTGLFGETTFGDVSAKTHSLTELACDERVGVLWVCLTPGDTFDIDQYLGEFAQQLASLHLDQWHLYTQRDIPGPGWKAAWDGYLESYHHNSVHSTTVGKYTIGNLILHDGYGPHQRLVFGRRSLGELENLPEDQWDAETHLRRIHLCFPNLAISGVLGDHCLVSQVFPGPTHETTVTRQSVLSARKPMTDEEKEATETFARLVLKAVSEEDYAIGFTIQQALRAGGNAAFTFGRNEPGVQHFHNTLAAFMRTPVGQSPTF